MTLQGLPRQFKSRFDPPKVVFPLSAHVPPQNRLGETQDTMRQEKSPHGEPGAAPRRYHLKFDAHIQQPRGTRRSPKARSVERDVLGGRPSNTVKSNPESCSQPDRTRRELLDFEQLRIPLTLAKDVRTIVENGLLSGFNLDHILNNSTSADKPGRHSYIVALPMTAAPLGRITPNTRTDS